ncbi:MAG: hypothetical protein EOM48_12565 [Bacilli bacterium]|nr:hypothetical protein [Bacilli bacterium]
MDRKELYQNVRKAYRLAYEVQDSIIEIVEYIRARIRYSKIAGKQLFSASIERHIPALDDYADQKYLGYQWSWDYFPTYMYTYYFVMAPKENRAACFSIVQVMDDGFVDTPDEDTSPSTKDFKKPDESESYLLFAFSIWKDHDFIWFTQDEMKKVHIKDERNEILRISETIKDNQYEPYVANNDASTFIVKRISLEAIGSKAEADQALQDFARLVQDWTGYQLLVDDPEEMEASHLVQPTQSVE